MVIITGYRKAYVMLPSLQTFWQRLFYLAGAACLIYFLSLIPVLGFSYAFMHIWLAAAMVFFAFGKFMPAWRRLPVIFRRTILILFGLGLALFIFVEGLILSAAFSEPAADADYLIILGAKVNGTYPSLTLQYRIDAAALYLRDNPGTIAIASGGQGPDEGISEGLAIYRSLAARGISENRIIIEDKSSSTWENLTYSQAYIEDPQAAVVVASSDFHVYRALALAGKAGYENVSGLAAKTMPLLVPLYYLRECLALIKSYLTILRC